MIKSGSIKKVKFGTSSTTSKTIKNLTKPKLTIDKEPIKYSIFVEISNNIYKINCGLGNPTLQWLFNAALHYHSNDYSFISGIICAYIDENESIIDSDFNLKFVKKEFINNQKIKVLLKSEYLMMKDELKKNKKQSKSTSKSQSRSKILR